MGGGVHIAEPGMRRRPSSGLAGLRRSGQSPGTLWLAAPPRPRAGVQPRPARGAPPIPPRPLTWRLAVCCGLQTLPFVLTSRLLPPSPCVSLRGLGAQRHIVKVPFRDEGMGWRWGRRGPEGIGNEAGGT